MREKSIGFRTLFGETWGVFKKRFFFILGVVVLVQFLSGIVFGLVQVLFNVMVSMYPVLGFLAGAVLFIIAVLFSLGMYVGSWRIALDLALSRKSSYRHLFYGFRKSLYFSVALILYGLLCLVGFCLLVIPGIYWGIKYSMIPLCMAQRNMGPIEAFRASSNITHGVKWKLLGLLFIVLFVEIAVVLLLVSVELMLPFTATFLIVVFGVCSYMYYLLLFAFVYLRITA